ncbi:MAG: hypothetical protein SGARI_005312, partial [Bacillariaceae sp.]
CGTAETYRYVRQEHVHDITPPLVIGAACWVLLSKDKGANPKLFRPARVLKMHEKDDDDDQQRILVQYPKGSTYRVKRTNLMASLEHASHLVLVASETNDYRRLATVHTTQNDHFVEIGCDFGILVDSVVAKSALGIDKSKESIDIAKQRYPLQKFLLGDVFEDDMDLPPSLQAGETLVVAIDINGNRDLPAVLQCIQLVMAWKPRLIVVKSRALHAKMVIDEQQQ